MDMNVEQLLDKVIDSFSEIDYIRTGDIPAIDLYMDQVTTFMDSKLKNTTRKPDEDKILTKTMINNYAKSNLLPPPEKKKYSKEHLLILIFIYHFKNILTMKDIETFLKPITDQYFQADSSLTISQIYDEVCSFEKEHSELLQNEIVQMYEHSTHTFSDVSGEDREVLQTFSFICFLCFDIYRKKQLIESLIDSLPSHVEEANSKEKKKKEKQTGHHEKN